jgi:glutamate-1-semialdehyde 2,1-aminomutase
VMQRKRDDHHASHSNGVNQFFHLLSSSVFIYCYILAFSDLTTAMCLGLAALFVRQFGHAILEPPCHDKEKLLLGYNTRNKTLIVLGYLLIPVINLLQAGAWTVEALTSRIAPIALHWFFWTLAVVFGRVAYLMWKHDFRISMIWFVKLITDPLTDIFAYFPRWPQRA